MSYPQTTRAAFVALYDAAQEGLNQLSAFTCGAPCDPHGHEPGGTCRVCNARHAADFIILAAIKTADAAELQVPPVPWNVERRAARKLAVAFARRCEEAFTAATLRKIRKKNRKYATEYGTRCEVCATHEHADANMLMLDAFKDTFGRDPLYLQGTDAEGNWTAEQEADIDLWSYAWTLAFLFHLGGRA